eukprot:9155401-Alexandrium_andersonii.AAC.2
MRKSRQQLTHAQGCFAEGQLQAKASAGQPQTPTRRGAANEQLTRARVRSADGQPVGEGRACEGWGKPNGMSHQYPG